MLVDTHCHLDEESFDVDRDAVLERARAAGVSALITIGTTAAASLRAVEIARQFESVYAAVGIQPNYVSQARAGDWEAIVQASREAKVVAIGETGMDRYWDYAPIDMQRDYFVRHLQLARERDLPFVVHCREAEADVLEVLREAASAGPLRGVMHSFAGKRETALECVGLGLHISFAGMVTYKKSKELRDIVSDIPHDRVLIETDAPYLAPQPERGKRNEPAFVVHTAACLAELLDIPAKDFGDLTSDNARRLFGLPDSCMVKA